jgi:predicted metal-dependent phosphoesterase TrpH
MIDLHSHTHESDGTFSPEQLVAEARRAGVRTLAITDHDTFAGYDQARAYAKQASLDLICGIELSTKLHRQSVHLLGYFFDQSRLPEFRLWLLTLQASRRERNVRLVERLRSLGFDITLNEVEARGRGMTGRPHFARLLMEKGYVSSMQQAFDEYLTESGKAYVERMEPDFAEGVRRIREAGGLTSLAHPVRLKEMFQAMLPQMRNAGLDALEAYHSDHSLDDSELYLTLAGRHGMLVTGGSDFHGANKPGIELATGRNGNVCVPEGVLTALRKASPSFHTASGADQT